MNWGKRFIFLLFWLIVFFPFSFEMVGAQGEPLLVEKITDNTFYDSFCLEPNWSWLCQGEAFSLPALNKEDGWFYFSQGFFDSKNPEKELVFTFNPSSLALLSNQPQLLLTLKSVTPAIGVVNLYFDWGQGWQIFPNQGTNWLVFPGQNQKKDFFLKEIFPQLEPILEKPWQLKVDAGPLISGQPVMLALDQAVIMANGSSLATPTPILTPTPTPNETEPTPSPVPTIVEAFSRGEFLEPKNTGKIHFNEAVDLAVNIQDEASVEKIILQYSSDEQSWWDITDQIIDQKNYYWSYRWYPEEEGVFSLRVKIYNQTGQLALINHQAKFIFDQTPPQISWQKPTSQDKFSSPLVIRVEVEDDLSGVEEPPRFYYRYQDWTDSWRPIPDNPWYFNDDLPLGDYWLRTQVSDRAGNRGEDEILLKKSLEIFNIFLVDNVLSWQTNSPTLSRVIYDQFSRGGGGLQEEYPNFGYAWASDQLTQQKTTDHQYVLPQLPPGKYFGRIVALEKPIIYSQEFIFKTDHFSTSESGDEEPFVLGQSSREINDASWPSPTQAQEKEKTPPLNWSRFLVILLLALCLGGMVVYFLKSQSGGTEIGKDNQ